MTEEHYEHDEQQDGDDRIIGTALRWSSLVIAIIALTVVGIIFFRNQEEETPDSIDRGTIDAPAKVTLTSGRPVVPFTDVTEEAGINFHHFSGAVGEKLLPETMGGGCAFLDYDNDGDADLFFVNSSYWPHQSPPKKPTSHVLYRNNGDGTFTDVTREAGLFDVRYGMGVAVGDVNNDGWVDLYITALGENRFYQNLGGTFEARDLNINGGENEWSTSAGFFDMENDGDLDLFVCTYVQWSREQDFELNFTLNGTDRAYGPPKLYKGTFSRLYRNDGDVFTDISKEAGIQVVNAATGEPEGKALAVTFADPDADGDLEIFVANDTVRNFFFENNGDGTFTEIGAIAGVAFDNMGAATGAMGIDSVYYADDDRLSFAIGNFANEASSFFVQQPQNPMRFADMSNSEGIGSPSRLRLSFGLFFFDYDLDGRPDMLQANGHLEDEISQIQSSQQYRQPAQLFWNRGAGLEAAFTAVPDEELGDLAKPIVGRGAAFADYDLDGDPDVLLTQTGGAPLLLRNDQQPRHMWLKVRLKGTTSNSQGIGARVILTTDQGVQQRVIMPTRSYLSQVEPIAHFGLGRNIQPKRIEVYWPGGRSQLVEVNGTNQTLIIEEKP